MGKQSEESRGICRLYIVNLIQTIEIVSFKLRDVGQCTWVCLVYLIVSKLKELPAVSFISSNESFRSSDGQLLIIMKSSNTQ